MRAAAHQIRDRRRTRRALVWQPSSLVPAALALTFGAARARVRARALGAGSASVSRSEFETFFQRTDTSQSDRAKAEAAAARARLTQPLKRDVRERPAALAHGAAGAPPKGRLDALMRRNYRDTWKKPLKPQPSPSCAAFRPSGRAASISFAGSPPSTPAAALPGSLASSGGRRPGARASMGSGSMASAALARAGFTAPPIAPGSAVTRMKPSSSMPALVKPLAVAATSNASESFRSCASFHTSDASSVQESFRSAAAAPTPTAASAEGAANGAGTPWQPNVSSIALTKAPALKIPSGGEGGEGSEATALRPFERTYLEKANADRLRFK